MKKQAKNSISTALEWYRKHGPNPLITSLLLSGGVFGLGRALWNPSIETLRVIGRPFGKAQLGSNEAWDAAMDRAKSDSSLRWWLPTVAGAATLGGALLHFGSPNKPGWGLTSWTAPSVATQSTAGPSLPLRKERNTENKQKGDTITELDKDTVDKTASLDSFVQDLDWQKPLNLATANSLFNDTQAFGGEQAARLTGKAIVNNAALTNNTLQPTLGNVFDSALDKINNKLTLSGVFQTGVRTMVANGAARLFTGALDSVCDLSPAARRTLVDAGTWAGAITSILN